MPKLVSSINIPRLVIAGTHSGVGKTTLTVGIIAALKRRGLRVQPFKVGPDYIDPTYHTLASGRSARTLDTWMIPRNRLPALFARAKQGADIAVIEGVMGLYDGFDYEDERGSTAEVAKLLGAPVVLVLDARSMARSAGAVALGFRKFDPHLPLAGFILNHIAGESHGQGVAQAVSHATDLPAFGWVPRYQELNIPERHLGLVPTNEPGRWKSFIESAADLAERYLDIDALLETAHTATPLSFSTVDLIPNFSLSPDDERPLIAVARDEAFSFTYPDNLELLQAAGAEISFFSPLRDTALPAQTRGVILSGGFPEVYAAALSTNKAMHDVLRQAHAHELPIYAECGGLMYLTEGIVEEGHTFPMVGLLPGTSHLSGRLTLGYRLAEAVTDSWLLRAGEQVRGHEFHYSQWERGLDELPPAFRLLPRRRAHPVPLLDGAHTGNLWASYVHLHFYTKPELASRFVDACLRLPKEIF